MKFYQDMKGTVSDISTLNLAKGFWVWYGAKGRGLPAFVPLERKVLRYLLGKIKSQGWTWDQQAFQELVAKVAAVRMLDAAHEDDGAVGECEKCGRPLDMCECGLGACQGHGA